MFVQCLENEGVEYIFGIPGEENEAFIMALRDSKIKFISTRHEQGAAFMADVYGRLTGKAGVCLSTLGPGATNLITGVADANLDRAPLVALTAQGDLKRQHKESHQHIDIVQAFKPITKWNAKVVSPIIIPEVVRKAFRVAQIEKPGATHIELPEDVAEKETDLHPMHVTPNPSFIPNESELSKAAMLIKDSKNPMILIGNGAVRSRASEEVKEFAEKNNIPVTNTFMSKGVLSHDHPLCLFTVGLQAKDYVMCNFDQADLIITIGYDLVEYAPSFWNKTNTKSIVHIDSKPAEVDFFYHPEVELVGDIKITLKKLTHLTKFNKKMPDYPNKLRKFILNQFEENRQSTDFPVKPQKLIWDLREAMAPDDILISDVGAHKVWIARMFPTKKPNTCIISNGFASMGIAVPGAIAAKLANPDVNIVAATGDGGFLMNSQELETAKRLGVHFTVVIFTDKKYGLCEWKQQDHYKKTFGVDFTNPDFVMYAESFGAKGYSVKKTEDLLPLLKKAIKAKEISIIEVPVDYRENFKLSEELGKDICNLFY